MDRQEFLRRLGQCLGGEAALEELRRDMEKAARDSIPGSVAVIRMATGMGLKEAYNYRSLHGTAWAAELVKSHSYENRPDHAEDGRDKILRLMEESRKQSCLNPEKSQDILYRLIGDITDVLRK